MNYLVIRSDSITRILLDEIAVLIIENNAVSMTGCLLSMLSEKKIKVILCDSHRNPQVEMVPIYGAHNDAKRIREQISWPEDIKRMIWTGIVREKIQNQSKTLAKYGKETEAHMLDIYVEEVQPGDNTNREGHAAKVYFNAMFGMGFHRDDENTTNAALNYGYTILLSAFNREIVASGYLTQLGIGHDNQFNHFNLSCDLMEPFRVLVDDRVRQMDLQVFDAEQKQELIDLLNKEVTISGSKQTVINAIRIYTNSVFLAINKGNIGEIAFVEQ